MEQEGEGRGGEGEEETWCRDEQNGGESGLEVPTRS